MKNYEEESPTFVIACSVIPNIWMNVALYCLWGTFVTILVELCPIFKNFGVSPLIITILGFTI
jgi:hypothetical protein